MTSRTSDSKSWTGIGAGARRRARQAPIWPSVTPLTSGGSTTGVPFPGPAARDRRPASGQSADTSCRSRSGRRKNTARCPVRNVGAPTMTTRERPDFAAGHADVDEAAGLSLEHALDGDGGDGIDARAGHRHRPHVGDAAADDQARVADDFAELGGHDEVGANREDGDRRAQ